MPSAQKGQTSFVFKIARWLRGYPLVWSSVCRGLHFYNTSILGAERRRMFLGHKTIFEPTELVSKHCAELRSKGYTVISDFVSIDTCDAIFKEADALFLECRIGHTPFYKGAFETLKDVPYKELVRTQKTIGLREPLLNITNCVNLAFDETILSITANFLGYIPPRFGVNLVRDFPQNRPRESSNFHKDNDEADSLQIFIYLVDIDDSHGPLVYVPGSHRYDVKSCRPRVSRDLGIDGYDGRISDDEVAKYYDPKDWAVLRVRRGSVAFVFGNGIHKGPVWLQYGDPSNKPRTALRIDVQSFGFGKGLRSFDKQLKIRQQDYISLTDMQRLFTDVYEVVNSPPPIIHSNRRRHVSECA